MPSLEKNFHESQRKLREYLFLLLPVLSLFIACIIYSTKKFFWNDELLSFYILNDPSFSNMMSAVSDKINQSPPLYFVLGWLWVRCFGSTELSLGVFSSLSIITALFLTWIVLRHSYNFWPTAVGVTSVFCFSSLVLTHNTEVRMYGLLTVACAFSIFQYDLIIRKQSSSWKSLAFNSIGHAGIVLTHLYGVFYSAAILIALFWCDRRRGIFQSYVYLSVLIGWASLVPFLPYLLNQSESYGWFYPFPFSSLVRMLIPFRRFYLFLACLILISVILRFFDHIMYGSKNFGSQIKEKSEKTYLKPLDRFHLLLIATLFILVPILPWTINSTIKPILSEGNVRYFIPTMTLGWSIILTHLTSLVLPIFPNKKDIQISDTPQVSFSILSYPLLKSLILLSFIGVFILNPVYRALSRQPAEPGGRDPSFGYANLPIAVEAGHDFLPRFYYSSTPNRYFHIRDWETVEANSDGTIAKGDYIILEALNRNYPFIQSVQSDQFLNDFQKFLVLNDQDQKWFEFRIKSNPGFETKLIGDMKGAYGGSLEVILVEKL